MRAHPPPTDVAVHDLDEVAPQWRRLCEATGAAPFHWPEWYQHWAQAFATAPLRAVAAYRNNVLVGVLALAHRRGGLHAPVNGHTPYYGPVLRDAQDLPALLAGLLCAARKGFLLQRVPIAPQQVPVWQACLSAGVRHHQIVAEGVSLATDVRGSWDAFVASRSPSRRRDLRRATKRLERAGKVDIEVHRGRDAMTVLPDCLALEAAGWKGREGTAILTLPATHRFYRHVGAWAADRGWLRITTLRLDGHLAAFSLDLEQGGVLYLLKTAYDEDLATFGPGTALSHALVREGFASPDLHRLEWLGDDESKRALSNSRIEVHRIVGSPAGLSGAMRHAVRLGTERMEDVARRSVPSPLRARLRATRARRAERTDRDAVTWTGADRRQG